MDSYKKIQKCGAPICRTCPYLEETNFFQSSTNGKKYFPGTNSENLLNCKSENIIYLMRCKLCGFQYIGETKNRLHIRFNSHRNRIKSNKSGQLVHKHFQENCHGLANCIIIPIEKIVLSESDENIFSSQVEKARAKDKIRFEREKFWISTLQTAYPFGLNCRVKGIGDFNPSQGFFQHFGGRRRRKRKHKKRKPKRLRVKSDFSLDFVLDKHRELANKPGYIHFFKTFLYSVPRVDLQILLQSVENSPVVIDVRLKDMIKMIANLRLFKPVEIAKRNDKDFYHLNFRDKGLDFINISAILRNKDVVNKIPIYFNDKEPPVIGYRFNKSIAGKLFNYRETLSEEGIDHFENNRLICSCNNSPFKDPNHGHVITGNLDIVKNETLRNLIKKGPKYRLPQRINWKEDRNIITTFLDAYIDKWITKERKMSEDNNVNGSCLDLWKNKVVELIDRKIESGKHKLRSWNLRIEGDVKRELDRLKESYVITVTDKAQNNILFTCKSHYVSKIKDELSRPGQLTYEPENKDVDTIHNIIINFSKSKNIKVPNEMKDIPLIYWIPKMHKNPIGSRFIAGSKSCSIKLLSKYFSKALKVILNHIKNYSLTVSQRADLNYFWIIENSLEFMDKIKSKDMQHMETYDFSTLYTALPHPEIIRNFAKIFQKVYSRENKQFINVNMQRAYFSTTAGKNCCSFRVTDMQEILEFILDNIYVKFGRKIYKQVIGIPIGLDSGQDIANLLLYSYEADYVEKTSKQNIVLARKFNLCSRYIDDLFVGNFPDFREHIYKIYPRELEIKPESVNSKEVSYLDLRIKSENGLLDFSIYDKRDDFNFKIVNFPFMDSCIPKKSALGVFYSQMIRFARINSSYQNFKVKCKNLTERLLSQGYKLADLKRLSLRFFKDRNNIVLKYDINDTNIFIKDILP